METFILVNSAWRKRQQESHNHDWKHVNTKGIISELTNGQVAQCPVSGGILRHCGRGETAGGSVGFAPKKGKLRMVTYEKKS
ncbi:hypothetical protein CEXT_10751 [Caerostris extrusa]|uniref:Uncharacterized protein n=1 Tax=Caerostris extrusa TaxID=172846 RepID=A0AAV4MZI4_CAEEX|nr:hypothetical protein CEXT_10751 [Caerostris extrusa]